MYLGNGKKKEKEGYFEGIMVVDKMVHKGIKGKAKGW